MNASCPTPVTFYPQPSPDQVVIAIPVRNEAARIGRLLRALAIAASRCQLPVTAVVLANNCTDRTCAITRNFTHRSLRVELREASFPDHQSSAGRARRIAMDMAVRDEALLMTTDGDAVPHPDWINAALAAIVSGADLVCGAISAHVDHVLATASGARITRAEGAYAALVHETRHYLDQMAGRQEVSSTRPHYMESGASIAMRARAYATIGGLPHVDVGEDRALVHRAEAQGLRIRYAPDMLVRVSARLHGRAQGGMAACLRERMGEEDPLADQAMLPLDALQRLWAEAVAGHPPSFPDRAEAHGHRLRASDLERDLSDLGQFVAAAVRPHFVQWMQTSRNRAA